MKRIILIVALIHSVIPVFSQISVGLTGGGNLSRFHYGYSDNMTNKFIIEWHAGVIAETRLAGHFYVQPQLLVSRQGGDSRYERHTDTETFYNRIFAHSTYLQLPVNVIYKYKRWYGGVGPYIARGLGGRYETQYAYAKFDQLTGYREESRTEGKLKFTDNPDGVVSYDLHMQAIDYGANFIGGYALKNGLFFNANFNMGLSGIYGKDSKVRNRYWGVSVGYYLIGKHRLQRV